MDRAKKQQLVAELNGTFAKATLVVVAHQSGLTVGESTDLRRQMREAGAGYRVTKNRLAKLALVGTPYEELSELFVGPTAIAFSADPIAAAKVAAKYAKSNNKLTIIGGAMRDKMMDTAGVQELAKLPSLDELRAQFIGLLSTPATRVAGVLQAPAGQLARVLKAYADTAEAA